MGGQSTISSRFGIRSRIMLVVTAIAACVGVTLVAPTGASAADYTSYLNQNSTLYPGDSLWSPNHLYRIVQQGDGNLVEYAAPGNKPFWSSRTSGHPGSVTQFQSDGNLVVYAPGHVSIWASGSSGNPNSVLFVQNDANVVVRAPGNVAVWATNAQNIAGCTDGSRSQAAQYARAGQFYTTNATSWTEDAPIGPMANSLSFEIDLRYNPTHRCAWALGYGNSLTSLWVDRSRDGGQTWSGGAQLGNRAINLGQSTSYTGVYNDSYPYVMRACEVASEAVHCTPWY